MENKFEYYYTVNLNKIGEINLIQSDLYDIKGYTGELIFTSRGLIPRVNVPVEYLVSAGWEVVYTSETYDLTILANEDDTVAVYEGVED